MSLQRIYTTYAPKIESICNKKHKKISFPEYETIGFIASGSYGEVYLAKKDGEYYAIKTFNKTSENTPAELYKEFICELNQYTVIDDFYTDGNCQLVRIVNKMPNHEICNPASEKYKKGNYPWFAMIACVPSIKFLERMNGNQMLTEDIIELSLDIIESYKTFSTIGIIHGDIKWENLLIGKYNNRLHVMFCDFNVAAHTDVFATGKLERPTGFNSNYSHPTYTKNVNEKKEITAEDSIHNDVYAIGMLMYELCCLDKAGGLYGNSRVFRGGGYNKPDYQTEGALGELIFEILKSQLDNVMSIDELQSRLEGMRSHSIATP